MKRIAILSLLALTLPVLAQTLQYPDGQDEIQYTVADQALVSYVQKWGFKAMATDDTIACVDKNFYETAVSSISGSFSYANNGSPVSGNMQANANATITGIPNSHEDRTVNSAEALELPGLKTFPFAQVTYSGEAHFDNPIIIGRANGNFVPALFNGVLTEGI